MKKAVWKGIVCVVVFLATMITVSTLMNKGNTDMTVEMRRATFPLVYMSQNGNRVNCLHGYAQEMQGSTMRDHITPLESGRRLSFVVEKFGCEIEHLSFEVRSVDGERLVEATDIYNYREEDDELTATITVKDLIEENTEYNLILILEDEYGRQIRYYTRIIQTSDYHASEQLAFAKEFHEKTFDKEAAKSITKYMESNAEGDNSSFSHVDIHSSFQQITWGELKVEKASEPIYTIRELGPTVANIEITYQAAVEEGGERKYYNVEEYYRIRYTDERMYLLDFKRDMNRIFTKDTEAFVNNKIFLGIHDPDVEMVESDGGNVLAFVNENRLFSYSIIDNKFVYLFGFYDEDNRDERTLYKGGGIKILSVDETENVRFLVYGYMNRGLHEGQVGIQVYQYNSMTNTIEEEVFIPDNRSYQMVKADVEQLSYADNNNHLYVMLSGTVYEISLESKSYKPIIRDLKEDSYKVSDSNRMIAWKQEEKDKEGALTLLNLSSKKQTEIKGKYGTVMSPLGFMEEDLIYGIANVADIQRDSGGKVVVPMYEICIQNENDEILKRYHQEGVYVVGADIQDNQISLTRVSRDEDGQYVPVDDDQIMNNEEIVSGNNTVELAVTEEFENVVQIALKSNIDKKGMKLLTPKEVLFEGGREVRIEPEETDTVHFYVYGMRDIEGIYTDAGNAVTHAEEIAGVVTNDHGAYVWRAGNRSIRNQIMKIQGEQADEERSSLAVCLDTILAYEGVKRNTSDRKSVV